MLLTLLAVGGVEAVSLTYFRVTDAVVILLLLVAYAGYTGGVWSGLLSAVLSLVYCGYYLGAGGSYRADEIALLSILAFVMPAVGLAVGVLRRKTERMARALVERQREFANTLMASIQDGVLLLEEGVVRDVNARFCEMAGVERSALVGVALPEGLLGGEDVAAFAQAVGGRGNGPRSEFDLSVVPAKGAAVPVLATVSCLDDAGAPACKQLVLVKDVTERVRTQEELRAAKERAESAAEEALAAGRAKDQFLAVLSHELRTPLTPVLAVVGALEGEPGLPATVRSDLAMVRRNVELEARLIDDLLDLTRITRGKLELRWSTVDLMGLAEHAVRICNGETATDKGLSILLEAPAARRHVWGDAARLQQVLWNLINNAVKFTPAGGVIGVRVFNDVPDRVVVEVSDTGIGIDPDVLPQVFDAFQQGGQGITRKFGGLGLGLAISRALIDAHGGRLAASSAGRGKGARFRIELATVNAPELEPVRVILPAGWTGPGRRGGPDSRLRVLLVEDHPDTAKVMSRLLRTLGHGVTTANCVAEGVEKAAAGEYDVLVSDIGLPDGTGLDLIERMQAAEPPTRPPVAIALSGFGMEEDVRKSLEAGFDLHLTKPVDVRHLDEAIRKVAGGAAKRAALVSSRVSDGVVS